MTLQLILKEVIKIPYRKRWGPYHNDQCTQCEARVATWEEHKEHVANYHNDVWKHRCGHCELTFDKKNDARDHRRLLNLQRSFFLSYITRSLKLNILD